MAIVWFWNWHGNLFGVPPHVRKGLLRLYVAIAVPWVAWVGYKIHDARQFDQDERLVLALLLIPVGGPLLYSVVLWVTAGFHKPTGEVNPEKSKLFGRHDSPARLL